MWHIQSYRYGSYIYNLYIYTLLPKILYVPVHICSELRLDVVYSDRSKKLKLCLNPSSM